ncbi:MAG: FHA domain-containing protein [Pyrinomonadaceae bacterium]
MENVDAAQYCDECGLPLSAGAAQAARSDARTPSILHMLNNPAAREGDADSVLISPDAPTRHDGITGDAAAAANGGSELTVPVAMPDAARAMSTPSERLSAAHATFIINRGRSAGKEFPLHEEEAYIGRWDADSGIFPDVDLDSDDPEAKVSRRHARVTRRGGQYYIEDLGSTNGTFINRGRRLLPGDRQPLNDDDEIIIGKTFLRFHVTK